MSSENEKHTIFLINILSGKCWEVRGENGNVVDEEFRFKEIKLKSFLPFLQGQLSRSDGHPQRELVQVLGRG